MGEKYFYFKVFFIIFIFSFLYTVPSFAQSRIEKATSEVDRLNAERLEEALKKKPRLPAQKKEEEQKPAASASENAPKIYVKKIVLTGCESFLPSSFSKILSKYENKEETIDQLQILRKDIEKEYLRRGIIATVFLPPQDVKDGVVSFQVVEIKMGRLELQNSKYFNKKRLAYYWDIPEGSVLRYDRLAKSLQIINRNPDREVKAVLRSGKTPGTTDVTLTSENKFPVHVISTFDNDGVTSSGKSRLNMGIRHNNFLGLDDTLLVGYSSGIHFNGKYAYHSIPITPKNTFMSYGYSESHSVPKQEFARFGIKSDAENVTFSLHQEFYNTEAYIGELFAGFDSKDKVIRTSSGLLNKDRLRMFSLGGTYIYYAPESVSSLNTQFYRGLSGFGASPKDNPYASRNGQAKPIFSKLNLEFNHLRNLPWHLRASLKYRRQIAWQPLTPQEEFNLGGMDSVRGYPASDFLADSTHVVNFEILSPAFFIPESWKIPYAEDTLRNETTLVGLFDWGRGDRLGTMFGGEKRKVDYMGVGAGLRFRLFNQAGLRLEWAYQLGEKSLTESGKTHFHFAVNFQDQLPEEAERIRKIVEEDNIQKWTWQLLEKQIACADSPLRKKLYVYLYLARAYQLKKDYQQSREYYQKIIILADSLFRQGEEYVRLSVDQKKRLQEYKRTALQRYRQGKLDEAKQLWQKIIDEGQSPPLVLEF